MPYRGQYRTLWIDAGYKPDMGSACAVKPPPPEWLAAYHFVSLKDGLDDIENSHIKVTRISEANDPFEFEGLTEDARSQSPAIKRWKNAADQTTGILCFSKDWTSPALWAHYASRHRGICLGFWIKKEKLLHVVYDTERTAIGYPGFREPLSDGTKQLLLRIKAQDWSYEEEARYPVELQKTIERDGRRFFQFDDSLRLAEVIIGEGCAETVDNVRSSLVRAKYQDVTVFRARSAFGFFKMVPDEKTVP